MDDMKCDFCPETISEMYRYIGEDEIYCHSCLGNRLVDEAVFFGNATNLHDEAYERELEEEEMAELVAV